MDPELGHHSCGKRARISESEPIITERGPSAIPRHLPQTACARTRVGPGACCAASSGAAPQLLLPVFQAAAICLPGCLRTGRRRKAPREHRKRRRRGPCTARRPHLVSVQGRCGMCCPLGPPARPLGPHSSSSLPPQNEFAKIPQRRTFRYY